MAYGARETYESFRSLDWWGPVWLAEKDHERAAALRGTLGVVGPLNPSGPGGNVFEVESPWHAALFLHDLQTRVLSFGCRLLFRGQRKLSPEYRLESTIAREEDLELARRWMSRFSLVLERMYPTGELVPLSTSWVEALGRHEGIPSSLLDFTYDGDVGVAFACMGASVGDVVVVYGLPDYAAREHGIQVRLAPPLSHRLHRQRGIFLESTPTDPDLLESACVKVVFPAAPFQPIRLGQPVDLVPEEPWMTALVTRTRATATQRNTADVEVEAERFLKEHGPHEGFVRPIGTGFLMARWLDWIGECLTWTTYVPVVPGVSASYTIDQEALGALCSANQPILTWWAKLMDAQASREERQAVNSNDDRRRELAHGRRELATAVGRLL